MENIYNNFLGEIKKLENEYQNKIANVNNTLNDVRTESEMYKQKTTTLDLEVSKLNNKISELSEELTNFNKVSLLRNLHVKYDKIKHKNAVLQRRVNYYKNKLLKNDIYVEDVVDLTGSVSSDTGRKKPKKKNKPPRKEIVVKEEVVVVDEVNHPPPPVPVHNIEGGAEDEDGSENEDFEEVAVELIKIKHRFYYSETTNNETVVYKAIKIKKGDYDVGDRLGLLVDNALIKD